MLRLLGSAGFAGKLLGAPKDLQYRRLREPIVIPLTRVAKSWTPFTFQAVADKLGPDGQSGPGLLLPGVLLRVGEPAGDDSGLRAFCLSCPHELCDVVLQQDTGLVPLPEGAKKQEHPLFVCPCHFSVFDPVANGAHLTGPAFYPSRFRDESIPFSSHCRKLSVESNRVTAMQRWRRKCSMTSGIALDRPHTDEEFAYQ